MKQKLLEDKSYRPGVMSQLRQAHYIKGLTTPGSDLVIVVSTVICCCRCRIVYFCFCCYCHHSSATAYRTTKDIELIDNDELCQVFVQWTICRQTSE